MKVSLQYSNPADIQSECLVVFALDHNTDKAKDAKPQVKLASDGLDSAASGVMATGDVTAKSFETTLIHAANGTKAKRLLIVGGGKAQKFSADELRKGAGAAVRFVKGKNLKSVAIVLPPSVPPDSAVRAITEGAYIADFDPNYYASDRKDQSISEVVIVAPSNGDKQKLEAALAASVAIGEAQNFTRDLVNEPSNRLTPTILSDRAKKMAAEMGLKFESYGKDKLLELKMGSFWGVAKGSEEPPALIVLTYEPEQKPAADAPVIGLVGKAITFDTGGISIKPADGMEKMKYDMAGGATMLGAMRAIAQLKPKVKVIAVVCAAENMPSGTAQKPGDVQFAMNGKAIEVINTDAEGRMVLADGLCYARQLGATHLIDAATLTGACVVALGMVHGGIFANDDEIYNRFDSARRAAGEKFWRLPLDDEYRDMIKSNIADIVNSGGRWGGAITAAKFLQEFVEDKPWIHLDIAGIAWMEENKPWIAKGPSGIAVRSVIEFVRSFA
jgi:leucyl aminopeptidase